MNKPPPPAASRDHNAMASADLSPGQMVGIRAAGWHVLLLRTAAGDVLALNDRCPHAAAKLSPGRLREGKVMCPLHGARFDPATGKCVGGPYGQVRTFPTREENGRIFLALPERAPEMAETPLA